MLKRLQLSRQALRRDRKLARKLREADAIVCSHTKSGRTWLRVMISAIYHEVNGIPANQLIQHDNFHRQHADIPRIYFGFTWIEDRLTGAITTAAPQAGVVYLVRDPRDTAASFYQHLRLRASDTERYRKGFYDVDFEALSLFDFMVSPRFGVPRICAYTDRWLSEAQARDHACIVRYEDLRREPLLWLRRTMAVLDGRDFADEVYENAVAFGSLDTMRQKERSGFFEGDRLGSESPDNLDSFKVRKAVSGGYRQELTVEQSGEIDRLAATSPAFQKLYANKGETALV